MGDRKEDQRFQTELWIRCFCFSAGCVRARKENFSWETSWKPRHLHLRENLEDPFR
jgi:hypothetical protein